MEHVASNMCQQTETLQSPDTNASSREILFELRGQKSELKSLKDELHGQSLAAAEVKKLKSSKDICWKFTGNRLQYEFNSELEDILKQIVWATENSKHDYAKELLGEMTNKLRLRNKHIRIAGSSEEGWETVRQYQSNPLASDSEDESKLLKADSRAVRKRKQLKTKSRPKVPSAALGYSDSMAAARGCVKVTPFRTYVQLQHGEGHSFRGYQGGPANRGPQLGPCFACGEFNHFRRACPYTRGAQQQQQQQQPEQHTTK